MGVSMMLITIITMAASEVGVTAEIPYSVADWPERFGNHRAVVQVEQPADAVYLRIPWRRADDHPEGKDVQVVLDGQETPIANRIMLEHNREYGDLVFQAAHPGTYHVYYMPYDPKRQGGYGGESYTPFANTADAQWAQRN